MNFLRWLFFLPLAAILIALAQTIAMLLAESLHWYFVAGILLFFGWVSLASSYLPCKIAPNHKISSIIILTLFVLFEGGTLIFHLYEFTWTETIARFYIDAIIIFGAIVAYRDERNLSQVLTKE